MKNLTETKTFNAIGIASGVMMLAITVPLLIVAHAKSKKEQSADDNSWKNVKDAIMVTGVACFITKLAISVISDGIVSLKK